MFLDCGSNINSLIINEDHLIKKHQIYCLEKLNSSELHNMQFLLKVEKPNSQTYFEKSFQNLELEWKDIYNLPRRVTINTNLRIFQCKLFHNILYLNKMLYKFGKKVSPLCSFLHGRVGKPNSSFSLLYKHKFSLDAATTFYPKCANNPSSYTTGRHLWIY